MQQTMLKEGKLLNESGNLNEAGYAFSLVKDYLRSDIKGMKTRIKEWDYYAVLLKDKGICFTISDCSLFALISVSLLDFNKKKYITKSYMKWFTFGKLNLPSSSKNGDVSFEFKNVYISFSNDNGKRIIDCYIKNFINNKDLKADIHLSETSKNSMVIATPFNKKGHFYYNQKINNLKVLGYFQLGDNKITTDEAIGVLDWGRGVWTYKNTWYWASLSSLDEDGFKGFNLGYGFGDTSFASENMVFLNEEAYKLDDVEFIFTSKKNKIDFNKEVKLISKSKDIDLTFTPILDRKDHTNAILIESNQHQLFGYFNGTIKTKNKTITFKNSLGFLEKVKNRW